MVSETQRAVNVPSRPVREADPLGWALRLARPDHVLDTPSGPVLSSGFPLPRPSQALAWSELEDVGGLLAGVGCGDGKTLIGLLAPRVLALSPALYLVPAGLLPEVERERQRWAPYYQLPEVIPYSYERLSRPAAATYLEDLGPRVIIADEGHWLANRDSTRWVRLWRYLEAHPECVFVDMTGTITGRSLREFSHRSFAALGAGSPLPVDAYHLEDWSECLDARGQPGPHQWRTVKPLMDKWSHLDPARLRGKARKDAHREALRKRLEATPGVILSRRGSTSASLVLHLWRDLDIPDTVLEALALVEAGESPGGEVFESDAEAWRCGTEVLAGFYYRWDWSRWAGGYHLRDQWLEARSDWSRYVRRELEQCSGPGYDSPALVRDHVKAAVCAPGPCRAVGGIYDAWRRWQPLSHVPPPPTIAVPLSSYLVDHAVSWAQDQPEPVLLWYRDQAVGQLLQEAGVPVYGSGTQPPDKAQTCGLSIGAHGRGRNLQDRWRLSLVLQPLSSGKRWEQLLARTHRPGQPHPCVEWAVYQHHAILRRALAQADLDAEFIASTLGNAQRLQFADRVVSPAGSGPTAPAQPQRSPR